MTKLLNNLARACRLLLAAGALAVVIWSFGFVGLRWWREHRGSIAGGHGRLTVLYWDDADQGPIIRSLFARYQQLHPEVPVEQIPCDSGTFPTKLRTMLASGNSPDLFYLQPQMLPTLASLHLLRPLDDLVAAERRAGGGAWLDDIFPQLLSSFRYDGRRSGVGPLYGISKDFTTCVMYVNVDLFNRAGVAVPYGGWTWDEYESVMKRIAALSTPQRPVYGGTLELWDDTFRDILWNFGGDYFTQHHGVPDFGTAALDTPAAQAAIDMIRRVRLVDKTVYNPVGVAKDDYSSFCDGQIGTMGPLGRWETPLFRTITDFTMDCVPVPHAAGLPPASMIITNAWAMSPQCRAPQDAYDLIRFLCGPDGQARMARLGLAMPSLQSVARSDAFLCPGQMPAHSQVFLDQIPSMRPQQIPRNDAQWQAIVNDEVLSKCDQLGLATSSQAAAAAQRRWTDALNSPLERPYPAMHWRVVTLAAAAVVIASLGAGLLWLKHASKRFDRAGRIGWLFIAPWVVGFVALTLGPMVLSLLLSLTKWTAMGPLSGAEFVGLQNFRQFLAHDPLLPQSLKVTLIFVLLSVPLAQAASLAIALLMNSRVRGITWFRTAYFVPSVVSGVALATLWLWVFNKDFGLLNAVLRPILHPFGITPPDWFGSDAKHWAIPAFVLMGLWGVGSGMVIYLAGLKGVPESLYEAATLDGAGPARRLWNVTLPMLSPLIFYNVVMAIIGSFQVFTQAQVMTAGGPDNATLFYVLNLYREAFQYQNMGYASAMAWVLFLLILGVTLVVFRGARGLVYYEGLRT